MLLWVLGVLQLIGESCKEQRGLPVIDVGFVDQPCRQGDPWYRCSVWLEPLPAIIQYQER
jgi:hypothetical protein